MNQLEAQKLAQRQAERKLAAEEQATTHSYVILVR
jgi:hypothetical protein